MDFQYHYLTDSIGVQITGIDLSKPVEMELKEKLNRLWTESAVMVIRNQKLTPEQFATAAEIFGNILPQQLKQFVVPEFPRVGAISSRDLPIVDGKLHVRGENFHTDHSNFNAPPKATVLNAIALPSHGGDTQFVDARLAFDELPDAMKRTILPLRSKHVYESSKSPRKMKSLTAEELAEIPTSVQPLVICHPDTGRLALYLNTGRMEGIVGMPDDEAYALINELYDHTTQKKYEYRQKWQASDMVIWDNRSVMHQANADFDPSEYRYLYRVMLKGSPLIPAENA